MRGGLLLLGLVLVVASGGGFWYVLQTVDERQEYVVTARTIERWEIVTTADFAVVDAHVGAADALPAQFVDVVSGRWATGRIPAGSLVAVGMFETPPLSSDDEAGKVLIEVSLPAGEAPFGELKAGDRVALFGAEEANLGLGDAGLGLDDTGLGVEDATFGASEPTVGLIGVLILDYVAGDQLIYLVTPPEAKAIQDILDRYTRAAERRIWKLGPDVTTEELRALYGPAADPVPAGDATAEVGDQ